MSTSSQATVTQAGTDQANAISKLRTVQKKTEDAAKATAVVAAFASGASEMATEAAIAAADNKVIIDDACAAAEAAKTARETGSPRVNTESPTSATTVTETTPNPDGFSSEESPYLIQL